MDQMLDIIEWSKWRGEVDVKLASIESLLKRIEDNLLNRSLEITAKVVTLEHKVDSIEREFSSFRAKQFKITVFWSVLAFAAGVATDIILRLFFVP